ncbi:phage tail protein [Kitasatospora sp. NPDC058048]|uniref:phage tail protein n=1 Tax=Kitasatospora sp. NPDC058048 TaxID=3346313 RepID=UPI0036D93D78
MFPVSSSPLPLVAGAADTTFASDCRFRVTVGPSALGTFATCDGLGCTVEYEERREGGVNDHVWKLPSRVVYSNVVLTRPVGRSSPLVWAWIAAQVHRRIPLPGEIAVLDETGRPLVRWALIGVLPVRWSGPSLSAASSAVATETLEIAHQGFIEVAL